jgi:uncharacterized membrane protein
VYGWFIHPGTVFVLQGLRFSSKQISLISTFIAIGAAVRIGVNEVGLLSPEPVYGVVIKVGLSETLSFVSGFIYGPIVGFITGFLIILLSDMASPYGPGAWTPFIASIIGLLGTCAGFIRLIRPRPAPFMMGVCAVTLTLLSEFLQNLWVSLTYNVPIAVTMATGISSLIAAMVNNIILFPTVGLKTIRFLQEPPINREPCGARESKLPSRVQNLVELNDRIVVLETRLGIR